MRELKDALTDLASRQQDAIAEGITTREIAHQSFGKMDIIDGEIVPIEEGED
jgi:hypothetical protein